MERNKHKSQHGMTQRKTRWGINGIKKNLWKPYNGKKYSMRRSMRLFQGARTGLGEQAPEESEGPGAQYIYIYICTSCDNI